MLGIIVSLFAALIALSFAFYSAAAGNQRRIDVDWRNPAYRSAKRLPAATEETNPQDESNSNRGPI